MMTDLLINAIRCKCGRPAPDDEPFFVPTIDSDEELAHCRPQPQSFMADEDADVLAVDDDYEER